MTRAGDQKKKFFLANIYERIWPKKISGDTEHEGETLSTGEGVVYMLHNVFRCCSQHTYMYARHLSVLVVVDTYGKHAYIHIYVCIKKCTCLHLE